MLVGIKFSVMQTMIVSNERSSVMKAADTRGGFRRVTTQLICSVSAKSCAAGKTGLAYEEFYLLGYNAV
jgi:hypothetical protein